MANLKTVFLFFRKNNFLRKKFRKIFRKKNFEIFFLEFYFFGFSSEKLFLSIILSFTSPYLKYFMLITHTTVIRYWGGAELLLLLTVNGIWQQPYYSCYMIDLYSRYIYICSNHAN